MTEHEPAVGLGQLYPLGADLEAIRARELAHQAERELDVPALQAEIASRPPVVPVVPNDAWRPEPLPPRWCGRLGRVIRRRHDWRPEPGMPASVSRCWRCRKLFYSVGTQGTSGRHPWPARP